MLDLYPFQRDIIARARAVIQGGKRSLVLTMPTGAGKTVTAAAIIKSAIDKGGRVMFIAHRTELIAQAAATLLQAGVKSTAIVAGSAQGIGDSPFQIGMVQTLARRITKAVKPPRPPSILIVDEAHHGVANTYSRIIKKLREWNPQLIVVGLSATPERLDGRGLKEQFDELIIGKQTGELIADNFLAPYKLIAPDTGISAMRSKLRTRAGEFDAKQQAAGVEKLGKALFGDVIRLYREHLDGQRAIFFGVDIAHSQKSAAAFNAAGISAAHIDGNTNPTSRAQIINAFKRGEINVLCNCAIVLEGFDTPSAAGVIFCRCTKSLTVWRQAIGRALRYQPHKTAVIIDCGANWEKLGAPDEEVDWSLDGGAAATAAKKGSAYKQCGECRAVVPVAKQICPNCGAALIKPREIDERRDAKMIVIDGKTIPEKQRVPREKYLEMVNWAAGDRARLIEIQRKLGYSHGWIFWQMKEWKEKQGAAA